MIDEEKLIQEIVVALKSELPDKYVDQLADFEKLVDEDLMRASYDVLDELRRKRDWNPSDRLQSLIREYQVVF